MNRYLVTLEFAALPSDLAGIRRLRGVLKRLLRAHGARCLDCRPAPAELAPNPDGEYSYRFADGAPVAAPKSPEPLETAAPCRGSCPT